MARRNGLELYRDSHSEPDERMEPSAAAHTGGSSFFLLYPDRGLLEFASGCGRISLLPASVFGMPLSMPAMARQSRVPCASRNADAPADPANGEGPDGQPLLDDGRGTHAPAVSDSLAIFAEHEPRLRAA